MRLVFVSSGWLCGVLNPVKSLYKQTYTTAQRRRRTENNEAEDRPSSFLFTFHWWIWAHDLTYAHTATTTHTHAHTRMWEHTKALRGASWTYPAQLPSHPYSSTLPSPTFVWNAAYTGPLKAPYRASNPPCTPRPSSPHTHPPVPVNPGLSAPSIALALSLSRWMNGPETQELWEKEAETAHINRMLSNWFVPPGQQQEHTIHVD